VVLVQDRNRQLAPGEPSQNSTYWIDEMEAGKVKAMTYAQKRNAELGGSPMPKTKTKTKTKTRKKKTSDADQFLKDNFQQMKNAELAEKTGLNVNTLRRRLSELGLKRKKAKK
jgi:DNA-binding NtrC family response regulator